MTLERALESSRDYARIEGMSSIIKISNLSKTYAEGYQALKRVDLEIRKGEIFALLGPNGAGKTTLISIVCGIVTPSAGVVVVDGHDILRDYRIARSKIGLVPGADHRRVRVGLGDGVFQPGSVRARAEPGLHRESVTRTVFVGEAQRQNHDIIRRYEAARSDRQSPGARAGDSLSG